MSTRLFGVAVVLTALAAAMNAMAYRTAQVTNQANFALVNTTAAELAFGAPTTPDPGLTIDTTGGTLLITVNEDIQKKSVYTWNQTFKITNNATYPVTLSYAVVGASWPSGVTLKLYEAGTTTEISTNPLAAAASRDVDMELTVDNTAALAAAATYDFTVTATR